MPNYRQNECVLMSLPVDVLLRLCALRSTSESVVDVISRLEMAATASSPNGASGGAAVSQAAVLVASLMAFLGGGAFRALRTATQQFLVLLGHAIAQQPSSEGALVGANPAFGGRLQFGTEADVANSGVSTRPLLIPGSSLYALTNLSTAEKRKILGQALQVLGYPESAIAAAQAALGRSPAAAGP